MRGFGWSSWLVDVGFLVEAKLGNLLCPHKVSGVQKRPDCVTSRWHRAAQ